MTATKKDKALDRINRINRMKSQRQQGAPNLSPLDTDKL
jgi:hypothetical protein